MDKHWTAKWIMDHRFFGLAPVNVFTPEHPHYRNWRKGADPDEGPWHEPDLVNQHMLVRKEFSLSEQTDKAVIDITADDYYKLYINGKFVGQGPAQSYYFHYNFTRYDISRFLHEGDNIIAVHVYYQGLLNRALNSADQRQGLIAEVLIDGEAVLGTDSSWKYTVPAAYPTGETAGYTVQFLENIDARLLEQGWQDQNFNDGEWMSACEHIADDHKLFFQITPPLQVYKIAPANVEKIEDGHYVIDFGHEITGRFTMEASGKAGRTIEIRCAEELDDREVPEKQGIIRHEMRCNCNYREVWTLSGRETDVLEHYDYKAFRYAEIIGPEETLRPASFAAEVQHYPFDEEKIKFECSNELLVRIWEICKNGVKYCAQEHYVDCPSREKGQYLGDVTVTAQSHMYLTGDARLFKKSLFDFALSSFAKPGLLCVAPGGYMQESADYSLQWIPQLIIYYRHTGDIEFLGQMYQLAVKQIDHFRKYQRKDGLLENIDVQVFMDWPPNLRDDYDFNLSRPYGSGCHNVINAFFYGALAALAEMRKILGEEPEKSDAYDNELREIGESYVRAFYNTEQKLFVDSDVSSHSALHSNIFPILYRLAPAEARSTIVGFLKKKRICCGVYMAYYLLKALASAGEHEFVYELLACSDEMSWAHMIEEGATSCFEVWGKDQKGNASLCHAWASAPIIILIEDIVGLTPGKPGWQSVHFDPHVPNALKFLNLEFETRQGKIQAQYQYGEIDIRVPEKIPVVDMRAAGEQTTIKGKQHG